MIYLLYWFLYLFININLYTAYFLCLHHLLIYTSIDLSICWYIYLDLFRYWYIYIDFYIHLFIYTDLSIVISICIDFIYIYLSNIDLYIGLIGLSMHVLISLSIYLYWSMCSFFALGSQVDLFILIYLYWFIEIDFYIDFSILIYVQLTFCVKI